MSVKSTALIAVTAIAAMSAGFWLSGLQHEAEKNSARERLPAQLKKDQAAIQGLILSPARKVAIPALTKGNGETFTIDDLRGHWSLLFFGYTHCPDICPATMGMVAQAKKSAMAINHIFPEVFFVSVDPDRDRPELLAEYVQYFDNDFVAVTGEKNLIKALTLQLSVVYIEPRANSGEAGLSKNDHYEIDHSAALLLFNPEGKLAAFFNPPHEPKILVKDFQTVVNLSN